MFNLSEITETLPKLQKIAEDYNSNLKLMIEKLDEVNNKIDILRNELDLIRQNLEPMNIPE